MPGRALEAPRRRAGPVRAEDGRGGGGEPPRRDRGRRRPRPAAPLLTRRLGALLFVTAEVPEADDTTALEPLARALGVVLCAPAQRREAEKALQEKTRALRERVKELACLVGVSKVSEEVGASLEEKVQRIADVVPSGMRYPETACVRVELEGRSFATHGFRETPRRLATPILAGGQAVGLLEVFYRDHRPAGDHGPFLNEERTLLEMVAERLGRLVETTRATELLRAREETFRTLLDVLPVAASWGHEEGGRIEHTNRRLVSLLGWSVEDVPTLDDWFRLTCPDPAYRGRVAALWRAAVAGARESGSIPPLETTMVGKDGVPRRVVVEATLIGGRILAVFDELESRVEEVDDAVGGERGGS